MIIKASQRGGGRALASHLMNERDNEHVELHKVRGFVSDDLHGAFLEAEAAAKGTKCKQHFFSVSLSPPETENVRPEVFELAARRIEKEMGLERQPMALVFHEKEGRRHAHAVWSRIDTENMRAINLPHFKRKLNEISRGLFLEHGWNLPDGYKRGQDGRNHRSPLNFTLAEWQQARRAGKSAADIKATFQECWNGAKDVTAFKRQLEERGYYLAQGDRRGFVAVDVQGEVYAIPRMIGQKTKAVKERLGDPSTLPSVDETKARVAELMEKVLKRHITTLDKESAQRLNPIRAKRRAMRADHKAERAALDQRQAERWVVESKARQARFSKGLKGVWDWLRGKHSAVRKRNEAEVAFKRERDAKERQDLITRQLAERRALQANVRNERQRHASELALLYRDLAKTRALSDALEKPSARTRAALDRAKPDRTRNRSTQSGGRSRDRTLEP
ncbi:relaxase/mobilization nuclease domain-containing protein [Erythrobacter sp. HL-111]|uniref:relaxase/mobilization nuclease domain-containing protein n=1 Tax=Erythrobacter sp. HL-111 TaxID=1798193 RepID=UPI0006DAEA06|nr:relaxase/mobilization nuclease domain-containing protein [Erythrobacter sp. HL-111]KPP90428.1 MAG: Relaxase/mobilization nuclease domain [Erythrobacteraceae bacterium HL-111]SDT14632.1 Relaxase/Mobilisation nuclease domain-containing protein [Erythrobacter sp. HL-111]